MGASVGAASIAGLFAKATMIGFGVSNPVGLAFMITFGGVVAGGAYDRYGKATLKSKLRSFLDNGNESSIDSLVIMDTEKDISYQLSDGELIVNGPMAMGADALLEECSTFSSFLSEMDVETNGVTLNVLNQVPIESYTIQAGDTLSKIAATYGTTVEKLMELNPSISDQNQIQADQELTLPEGSEETVVEETQRLVSAEEQALLDQFTINEEDGGRIILNLVNGTLIGYLMCYKVMYISFEREVLKVA